MTNWRPNYYEFHNLFSNDYTLKILAIISQQNQKLCAADIAKLIDVHVSTAKKYLNLLKYYNFIEEELFPKKPGKPTYYSVKTKEFIITLDMPYIAQTSIKKSEKKSLPNPFIREKLNPTYKVKYIFNNRSLIEEIIVKKKTKARRFVKQKISLMDSEKQFMKYIPHPTMQPEPFIEICKKANLIDFYIIKSIIPFIEKLKKFDIIEINDIPEVEFALR